MQQRGARGSRLLWKAGHNGLILKEKTLSWAFLRYSANSAFVAGMAALGQIFTASLAGFAFARMRFRGSNLLFGILLATTMIPVESIIIPEFLLMARLDWLNTYLPLIVPSFLVGTLGTFMLREFFASIPDELVEAAVLDGASTFRIYWNIFLPLSLPAMTTSGVSCCWYLIAAS